MGVKTQESLAYISEMGIPLPESIPSCDILDREIVNFLEALYHSFLRERGGLNLTLSISNRRPGARVYFPISPQVDFSMLLNQPLYLL